MLRLDGTTNAKCRAAQSGTNPRFFGFQWGNRICRPKPVQVYAWTERVLVAQEFGRPGPAIAATARWGRGLLVDWRREDGGETKNLPSQCR
jgi:hypothetical protein